MTNSRDKKALKKFGDNLSKLRKEQNLSLRELSYACNIDHSKIGKIEKGQINITLTTLFELAKGLEVDLSRLVEFSVD
jgi:transcriptional regulator with XRE-family HTH domain